MTEMACEALTEELRQLQVRQRGLSLRCAACTPRCAVLLLFTIPRVTLPLLPHQEQASHVQTQLDEEELKNSRLLQQIAKLEEQIAVISQESDRKDEVGCLQFYLI